MARCNAAESSATPSARAPARVRAFGSSGRVRKTDAAKAEEPIEKESKADSRRRRMRSVIANHYWHDLRRSAMKQLREFSDGLSLRTPAADDTRWMMDMPTVSAL